MKYVYLLVRLLVGGFFIFSGVVKAIDPMGTGFKMEEYFEVFSQALPFMAGLWEFFAGFALPIAIAMIVFEIFLGISLIFGTLPRLTLWGYAGLIGFFTILTGYSAYTGKVTDCGCFGDFMKLKPIETFSKDVVLSVITIFLFGFRKYLTPLLNPKIGLSIVIAATLWALWFDMRNVWDLPIVDFRPYKIGTDINKGRSTEGLDEGLIQTFYVLKNKQTGETKEIESMEYTSSGIWKDKNWEIDKDKTRQVVIREPQVPKIKDLIIIAPSGNDITDSLLAMKGFQFWVTSWNLDKADHEGFTAINAVMRDAKAAGVPIVGLSNAPFEQSNALADSIYTFNNLDPIPVKTMMRSNPGVILIKDNMVVDKWHCNHLPTYAQMKSKYKMP